MTISVKNGDVAKACLRAELRASNVIWVLALCSARRGVRYLASASLLGVVIKCVTRVAVVVAVAMLWLWLWLTVTKAATAGFGYTVN